MNYTNSSSPEPKDDRPFRPGQHFFWIEAAFLLSMFKDFISKSAWTIFVLFCRRCSPYVCPDGVERAICFSGINDIVQSLGIGQAAAIKAVDELRTKMFIRPRPELLPPSGKHFLKGAATEALLLPFLDPASQFILPVTDRPRSISNIFTDYKGFPNGPIYLPSKLVDEGNLKRLLRSWDQMRLLFRLYDLVDHAMFGAVPHGLAHVEAVVSSTEPTLRIDQDIVGNPALAGKEVIWLVDFDQDGWDQSLRYRITPDLYAPLGLSQEGTVKLLIELKAEGLIRWKCAVLSQDTEDPYLTLGAYENRVTQYDWLNRRPGLLPYVQGYFGDSGGAEQVLFVVTPMFQPQTKRVQAYRAECGRARKKFKLWADGASEAEGVDE
jgi:hypothetical protein